MSEPVAQALSESKNTLYCSFCGKSQHEVKKLIAGPTVFICDECVILCVDIIKEVGHHVDGFPLKTLSFQELTRILSDNPMPIAALMEHVDSWRASNPSDRAVLKLLDFMYAKLVEHALPHVGDEELVQTYYREKELLASLERQIAPLHEKVGDMRSRLESLRETLKARGKAVAE